MGVTYDAKGPSIGKLAVEVCPKQPQPWPHRVGVTTTKPGFNSRVCSSVTNDEILRFWRQRYYDEEDHLLSALKAAARMRCKNLSENDYKRFEQTLVKESADAQTSDQLGVGIKDWWTKSTYAYLNQPSAA